MEKKETINIFLNNDSDKEKIFSNPDLSEKRYIIHQNDVLHTENRELRQEIELLKKQVDELESENENFDSSKRYTRGLLKNLVELEKLRREVSKTNKYILDETVNKLREKYEKEKYYFRILETVIAVCFAILYSLNIFEPTYFFLFSIGSLAPIIFVEEMFFKFKIPSFTNENKFITSLEDDIKKISDSQDFLTEYIDCL